MNQQFDELPKRPKSHQIEGKAVTAFEGLVAKCEAFLLQSADISDYGTDCQIEVVDADQATNVRIHVQVKGTENSANKDGSFSVSIRRTTLNYLLAQPYSFFVCFHAPTNTLVFRYAEDVLRQYQHSGINWVEQTNLTVNLAAELTIERLQSLASLARSNSTFSRNFRAEQIAATADEVPGVVKNAVPSVHVPENKEEAIKILSALYQKGDDEIISAAFDKFAVVIGADCHDFIHCFMAEINLGMASRSQSHVRIESAIKYFQAKLDDTQLLTGSLHYNIGNAFSALGDEEKAKNAYLEALSDERMAAEVGLLAQVHKNLGTSFERLNQTGDAITQYLKALQYSPNLPEANYAVGMYYIREGEFEKALERFDHIVFDNQHQGRTAGVSGWRINALFNLKDGRAAFREINTLLGRAESEAWIWLWCAKQITLFGRVSIENAKQTVIFWKRLISTQPNLAVARRELLLAFLYLRSNGEDIDFTFTGFRTEFEIHISYVPENETAFLWDRLGHWAQDEGDWIAAEICFRKAWDLDGGEYGYCLGVALNSLGKHEESLPILKEQAETIQPDAMSWFQVAVAQIELGQTLDAIESYKKTLKLDPDYDLAMFNLGGAYWNTGDVENAKSVWNKARQKFPNHELTERLNEELSFLFDENLNP